MYYPGIFQAYFLFYSTMQYLGWVGQFEAFLMTKNQNARVGDVEMKKINCQQHPQGLLESQKASPASPNRSRSSLLVLTSDAFCFLIYRHLWFILICCSSVKLAQILHGDWLVTKGMSPLPDSLQVGQ